MPQVFKISAGISNIGNENCGATVFVRPEVPKAARKQVFDSLGELVSRQHAEAIVEEAGHRGDMSDYNLRRLHTQPHDVQGEHDAGLRYIVCLTMKRALGNAGLESEIRRQR